MAGKLVAHNVLVRLRPISLSLSLVKIANDWGDDINIHHSVKQVLVSFNFREIIFFYFFGSRSKCLKILTVFSVESHLCSKNVRHGLLLDRRFDVANLSDCVSATDVIFHVVFGKFTIGIFDEDDYLLGDRWQQVADGADSRLIKV